MFKILLALHVLFAVFAIGPLVQAATTAGRGVRKGDGAATAGASRLLRIYAYVSALVVVLGFALMRHTSAISNCQSLNGSANCGVPKQVPVGEFGDTWIWLSLVLWVVAIGVVLGVVVPTLDKATALIAKEESVVALTARVAAAGGVVGLIFVTIVFLMVYRPGG